MKPNGRARGPAIREDAYDGSRTTRGRSDAAEVWPDYDKYQASTDRDIPLVVLEPR